MGLSIAVAGKGGVGKTTLAALIVRALRESGTRSILAVDADPNSNLAEALGVEVDQMLADIREKSASPEGSPSSGLGRARAVDDEIQRAVVEEDGFDLVTMGRPEGPRCYCYVNGLLRKSLDALAANYDAVVLDNEAGLEHLSRRTTNNVDVLVSVMDATMPAFRAAKRIVEISRELPVTIGARAIVVNRVPDAGINDAVSTRLGELLAGGDITRLPDVPQDDAVEQAGAEGRHAFEIDGQSTGYRGVQAVLDAISRLKK